MPRGGWRENARGKVGPKPKFRPVLPTETGAQMKLIAWRRYGRPTTDEETAQVLAELINKEARRITMAVTEIWQHRTSGDVYLVRVAGNGSQHGGEIIEANGPVTQADAEYCHNEAGGLFDGDAETTEWVTEHADDFWVTFPYESA